MPEEQQPPPVIQPFFQSLPPAEIHPADNLQFQKAEFASTKDCTICRSAVAGRYYQFNGSVLCEACAERKRLAMEPPTSRMLGKSVLFGFGAALAGSALYGIVMLTTGSEFALLSILVGVIVGKAMMRGSGGRGGRTLQIAALLLTYLHSTMGYLPSMLKGAYQKEGERTEPRKKDGTTAPLETSKVQQPKNPAGSLLGLMILVILLVGLALIFPPLMIGQGIS